MHGRTFGWLAYGLAFAVAFAACHVALAQSAQPMLSDPGYTIAADTASMPALQQPSADTYMVSNNNAALSQRVNALEAALTKLKDEKEDDGWEDVSGEKFNVKLGGRIYGDAAWISDQNVESLAAYTNQQDYFEFRRLRLFAEGTGYGVYDYKLQFDWAGGTAVIKDMYGGIHEIPYLGYVRMGHFKAPFSIEELTSSKYITFMERGLPNAFAPSRKVGIAAYNHNEAETITWGYGAFYANIDDESHDRIADNQGLNLAARATWNPVYTAGGRGVLHFGGAVDYQDLDGNETDAGVPNNIRFRSRPEIHATDRFANTGYLNARNYVAYDLEMASVYGPLSIQSELVYTDVDGINGTPDVDLYGAYVYASYFLTGENRSYKRTSGTFGRVKPFTNFFCVRTADGYIQSGWGAWELAARYSYLDFTNAYPVTNENLAGLLNDFTLGVNWYWNPHMRMMVNYVHSWGTSPAVPGAVAETDILAARWQVDF